MINSNPPRKPRKPRTRCQPRQLRQPLQHLVLDFDNSVLPLGFSNSITAATGLAISSQASLLPALAPAPQIGFHSEQALELVSEQASESYSEQVPASNSSADQNIIPEINPEVRLPMQSWQEKIRFGCTANNFEQLHSYLCKTLPYEYGCVFMGSGDYHHVSCILLELLNQRKALPYIDLLVCDNHPDNMRYPFGIHCGSWVYHASKLDFVRNIYVVGISSPDITLPHAWENYLSPFLRKKLSYWSINSKASWLALLGRGGCNQHFASPNELVRHLSQKLEQAENIYLSIDKDVFSPNVVKTNWDQGFFQMEHMQAIIDCCNGKLVGADVTGEVSEYHYKHWFKRFLSRLDGQVELAPEQIKDWQEKQREVNVKLLAHINKAMR